MLSLLALALAAPTVPSGHYNKMDHVTDLELERARRVGGDLVC